MQINWTSNYSTSGGSTNGQGSATIGSKGANWNHSWTGDSNGSGSGSYSPDGTLSYKSSWRSNSSDNFINKSVRSLSLYTAQQNLKIASIALAIMGAVLLPLVFIALWFSGPASIIILATTLSVSGASLLGAFATGMAHLAIQNQLKREWS